MRERLNRVAAEVVELCFQIHRKYGPGLFESVYEEVLCYELGKRNMFFRRQFPIPVIHDKIRLEIGFRADLIVEELVLFELKSIEKIEAIHFKQVITYLKLTNLKLGLLINFNEPLLKNGIKRIANGI